VTWHHVAIIVAALVALLVCGLHPTCSATSATIGTLATVIVGGVFGHAGRKEKEELTGPGTARKETSP